MPILPANEGAGGRSEEQRLQREGTQSSTPSTRPSKFLAPIFAVDIDACVPKGDAPCPEARRVETHAPQGGAIVPLCCPHGAVTTATPAFYHVVEHDLGPGPGPGGGAAMQGDSAARRS